MGSIHGFGSARSRTLERQRRIRYIDRSGHCFGARSRGYDPGPGCSNSTAPPVRLFGASDSDRHFLTGKGGCPTVRRAPRLRSRLRAASWPSWWGRPFLLGPRPARRSARSGGALVLWARRSPSRRLSPVSHRTPYCGYVNKIFDNVPLNFGLPIDFNGVRAHIVMELLGERHDRGRKSDRHQGPAGSKSFLPFYSAEDCGRAIRGI